ncbi:hypothetical protein [Polaromonas sp. A23]|uniref:hypothetical protein n=1 Tax=Polaromonas sp. A23 TaxID=1944133 RepID=UPI0011154D0F|nr:hypothetical protein [Polaromonas sp. A23]
MEQTLLTYPEWFLVFSPYEYGEFIGVSAPSRFPYYGHVGQFWESYRAVFDETRRRGLDLNPGYHLMIMVIGTSTTVEYAIKSAYETLVGRLAESTADRSTPEDRHAAAVAQDYVRFIRVQPWYEYDFGNALSDLWRRLPATGPDMVRKWERRFALTTEYIVKMGYAKLIKLGTKSIYDAPLPVTAVVVRPQPGANRGLPELKVLSTLQDSAALITIPRYEAFMTYAQSLAGQGINFSEIAGNDSFILVSVLAPRSWKPQGPAEPLLVQPILTQPGIQRVVMMVPVSRLADALRQWAEEKLQVEHIFDY